MENIEKDTSLIGCMRDVPDPRAPYNQRHKFLDIIIIVVTAILAGMDTWNEIADWAVSRKEWLGAFLELESVSYSIYSRQGMTAEEYGRNVRAHWGIENRLHWVPDIGFREDESRIRTGNAAENINVARHMGVNMLKQEKAVKWGLQANEKSVGMTWITFIKCCPT